MSLILRKDLTRPLSHEELDGNFTYLNVKYWQKQPYEVGQFVLRDENDSTVLYYCNITHTEYEYDTLNGGDFIAEYIDGGTGLPVIIWKMVGGTGNGVGTITGATNLEGSPTQPTNTDTYTAVFKNITDNSLNFKTLNSPDGSIIITNDNGTIYLSANITPIGPVNFSVESVTGVTCYGGFDGGITAIAAGGSGSFRFTKDSGITWTPYFSGTSITYTFTGLTAGSYGVGVYDQVIGAQPYTTVNVTGNTQIILTKTSETRPLVPASPTGVMNFSITGGTPPYTYNMSGTTGTTMSTFSRSSLPASTYVVSVTDSLGCSISNTYTLAALNTPMNSAIATKTDPLCSGGTGTINVTISNGSGYYRYSLNSGSTYNPTVISGRTFTITTGAGTYNLVVKDEYDNTTIFVGSYTIINPPQIGLVTLTGTTGYCGAAPTVFVKVSGFTGTPYISVNNGASYASSTSLGTTFNLPANTTGTAQIKYYDSNCPYTGGTTFAYSGFTAIATGSTIATAPVCSGDLWQYAFTVTGGSGSYDYRLSGTTTQSVWGSYTGQTISIGTLYNRIQFRDVNSTGCSVNYAVNNSSPSPITATVSTASPIACSGGTGNISFTLAGGTPPYEYIILSGTTSSLTSSGTTGTTSGTQTISGLRAGYYSVIARTSGSTCSYVTGNTIQLTDPSPIYLSGVTNTSGSCGGNATVIITVTSSTAPTIVSTLGSGGTVAPLGGNVYQKTFTFTPPINTSVTFSYYNGCPYTGTTGVTVTAPSALAVTLGSPTNIPKCPGDYWEYTPTIINGTPPYQYRISGGTWTSYTTGTPISIIATSSTVNSTTTINFRDSLGCGSGTTYNVNNSIVNPITVNTFTVTQPSCATAYSGSIYFVLGGGANFSSPANVFQYLLVSGSTSGSVTSSGATWGSLSPGITAGTITGLPDGYYKLIFRTQAGSGCTSYYVESVVSGVTTPTPVSGSVVGYTGVTTCSTNNGMIQITATGGTGSYQYKLDSSPTWVSMTSLPFTITGQSATTHSIAIRDTNTCAAVNSPLSVALTGVSNPILTGTYTKPICGAGNATITMNVTGTPDFTYYSGATSLITTSATSYSFFVTPYSGANSFKVIDGAGCTTTISITGSGTSTPMSATLTISGTTLTVSLGGSSVPSYTYSLYSGTTVAGGTLVSSYSSIPFTTYNFTGLTPGGQYIVRVTDANGCTADSGVATIPAPAYLYYGFYQTGAGLVGTPTAPIIYRGSGAGAALSDFTTTQTYTNRLTSTTGQTINDVVSYMVSQNSILGGQNSPIDLTTALPGGFSSSTPLTIPLTGVSYGSAYIYVLVPNLSPWTTNLAVGNHIYQGTTLITGTAKYTGGTSIIISGINYNLYRLGTSSYGAGTSFTNINIQ